MNTRAFFVGLLAGAALLALLVRRAGTGWIEDYLIGWRAAQG